MAPNPRVVGAFRAMKALGISEEKVKPVLKNLLRLFNKNWDLIEEENYRALADAIFEYDEAKEAECKKSSDNAGQEAPAIQQEAPASDEPERPLKRLRLKHQVGQPTDSPESHLQSQSIGVLSSHPPIGNDSQPGSSLPPGRNKGKQPISSNTLVLQEVSHSSQPSGMDRGHSIPKRAGSSTGSGILTSPTKKSVGSHTFIKPKEEPITDDLPHLKDHGVSIIPDSPSKGEPSAANGLIGKEDAHTSLTIVGTDTSGGVAACRARANSKPERNTAKSSSCLEVASSPSGEVKVILNCGPVLGRSDFRMPTIDAVLKLVEEKCLQKYKDLDPNFSVMKVMTDVCQSFWELGSESTNKTSAKQIVAD